VDSVAGAADRVDLIALTRALVDIDSTTGREGEAGEWLVRYLRDLGFSVTTQPVDASRFNVFAVVGEPTVVFSTHFDCVPPFFPSHIDGDRVYGRGSCDAKGILAAQVAAADRLRRQGERAGRHAVHALRLRPAVFPEPDRRRSSLRPRVVRRERHSRRAGRRRRTPAAERRNTRRPAVRRWRRARQRRREARE